MSIQSVGIHDKNGRLVQPTDYSDGRTKQAFKDETDINKILHRAQKAGTMSHLEKYAPTYGDFAEFDFLESQVQLTKGREIFDRLPSELRDEFKQSPAAFFDHVNDPANMEKSDFGLAALAAPGRQNIDVSATAPPPDDVVVAQPSSDVKASETTIVSAAPPEAPKTDT